MVEIKVQAADSASAMEEVEKRLGSDALIVSTTKVDGKIEITATNDEPLKYQKNSDPLILGSDYRVSNFSDILAPKVQEAEGKETESNSIFDNLAVNKSIQSIKAELVKLEKLSSAAVQPESSTLKRNASDLFQLAGVTKNVCDLLNKNTDEKNVEQFAKTLSKTFVHGKCPNFENSQIFLIIGSPSSGKSVFLKKFMTLMNTNEEISDCVNIKCHDQKLIADKICSWASKNAVEQNEKRRVAVSELNNSVNLDKALLEIYKYNPELKISVINACEVGKSYHYLKSNFLARKFDNEYLAITKLDLCDLSLGEISAFVELNHKCMFFSGIETETDGLFFAQVDKVMSHILQTVGSEEVK